MFVAMSFDSAYEARWKEVIDPAIRSVAMNGVPLSAYRVDLSQSGNSILTDITDGIAHSQFILANVSTAGHNSVSSRPYRNGNVMYEVGIALAARQPSDVLLVRDDNDPLLFDVTVIPHARMNFANVQNATAELTKMLVGRLREQERAKHAKIELAVAGLTAEEMSLIDRFGHHPPTRYWNYTRDGHINFEAQIAIPRLLDKGMIVLRGKFDDGNPCYGWTELGLVAARIALKGIPEFKIKKSERFDETKAPE